MIQVNGIFPSEGLMLTVTEAFNLYSLLKFILDSDHIYAEKFNLYLVGYKDVGRLISIRL